MPDSAMPAAPTQLFPVPADEVRRVVLSGPGAGLDGSGLAGDVLPGLIDPQALEAALARTGHAEGRRQDLGAVVCATLVLGLCLFSGEGYPTVLQRLWPLLGRLRPALRLRGPVSAAGLSKARTRLPTAMMKAVFEAGASRWYGGQADPAGVEPQGQRMFGLLATAVDGTVFDLAATDAMRSQYATPSGGRFPQARVVTLVACGTRRVLGAEIGSSALSEQALWDRLVTQLQPGTINFADRNFFSMNRWRIASATGAHLVWRVKNGRKYLPAEVIATLPDGSYRVLLRESANMLGARRKAIGDPKAPRLEPIIARMIEFTVFVKDENGRGTFTRFRVLTTLLDHEAYPAAALAAGYAERWQVEITYKTIKSTLRGPGRRTRGQSPGLAEQEIWGLLTVYNMIIDHAVATAVGLGIDPDEISFITVLRAVRDHLGATAASRPCSNCGHHDIPTRADLAAAILRGPRNPSRAPRTGPRTAEDRKTDHTRKVEYTITIGKANLPRATETAFS